MHKAKQGFSLIELLLVVAIIAILTAVSVPTYQRYISKTQIEEALGLLAGVVGSTVDYYNRTGSFPTSVSYNNVSIASGSWAYLNFQKIYDIYYAGNSGSGNSAMFGIVIGGLAGIPNYIQPSGGQSAPNSGSTGANTVYVAVRDVNGSIKSACGQYNAAASGQSLPLDFLPAVCQCTDVYDYWNNGTGGC